MNKNFETAEKKCIDSIVTATLESSDKFKNADKMFQQAIINVITLAAKVAFAEGYDVGYCAGMDEVKTAE